MSFGLLLAAWLLLRVPAFAQKEWPPAAPPPKPLNLPAPALRVLPNGLQVIVIERHTLPLVTLRLVVRAGAESDPAGLPGTAQMTAGLLTEGTKRRTAQQIAEAVDSGGGLIDAGGDWDYSYVTLSVLTDHTGLAYDVLSDIVMHPAFEPSELERRRKQTLSALEVVRDDPSYVADMAARHLLFGGTGYSHPDDGTLEAVRRMTAEDIKAFHARAYRPSNAILAVVGDVTTQDAFEDAEKFFGGWDGRGAPAVNTGALVSGGARQTIAIDKPDAVQTEIRVATLGVPRNDPGYYALRVADQILGGPASNRLFRALRTREGLAYGASSDLLCYRGLGGWIVKTSTRTPETVKSVEVALEQIKDLRDHAITAGELETAQNYLIGHLALDFETSDSVASHFLELMLDNLPLDYWNRFPDKIRALTLDDVREVSRHFLNPEANIIVLVGNVAGFKKDLKKLGPVQVIPLSDLDFASQDLLRPDHALGEARKGSGKYGARSRESGVRSQE